MPTSPPTRGGRRPGSGRKPSGRRPYLIRMKPETMRQLKAQAAVHYMRVGEYLDRVYGPIPRKS